MNARIVIGALIIVCMSVVVGVWLVRLPHSLSVEQERGARAEFTELLSTSHGE